MKFFFVDIFPDEDDDKKTRKERDEERARKRVLTSSLLHDLRGDIIPSFVFVILTYFKQFVHDNTNKTSNYHVLYV